MKRAYSFKKNINLHEQYQHASSILSIENNLVRMKSHYLFNVSVLVLFMMLAFVQAGNSQTTDNKTIGKDTTITIQVAGIACEGDLPIICKRAKTEKGVIDCKAVTKAAATTKFDVTYNPKLISYQQIVEAVQDAPSCDFPNEKPYRIKKKK